MDFTRIFAIFAMVITMLFNWFPNSEIISEIYYNLQASQFDWITLTDTIENAVENKDAEDLASMASKKLMEKHPDLEMDIQKLFDSIKGEILSVEDHSEPETPVYCDYSFKVITTTDDYFINVFYLAVGPDDSVLGLRRMMISVFTDEYNSLWTDTENYITEGIIEETERFVARRWNCGKGNSADEYVFMVVEDYSMLGTNVRISASRNNWGVDVPASGYAFEEDDELDIYLIPEGEEPPAPGTKEPDVVITAGSKIHDCCVNPGRYYLYVEPNDMDMYYSISVGTKL